MLVSATYICPIRGLAGLEPPEPVRLGQAARMTKSLGLERLLLPVLEESLLGTIRGKVRFLDGLIEALDQVAEAGLTAWLIAPAQRLLGLDWVPPNLVRAVRDPEAGQVFVDGRVRNLWPFDWWGDASLIQKRLKVFRDLVATVHGHPALTGWLILDRVLEWARPEPQVADLVLKSFLAEIREQDESGSIYMSLGWSELLAPETAQSLAGQVDGLRICGLESLPPGLEKPANPAGELLMAGYMGVMAEWIFGRSVEVEIGWGFFAKAGDPEETLEAGKRLAEQGLAGVTWLSLIDPEPRLYTHPPWIQRPDLMRTGLLNQGLEPKEWFEPWLEVVCSTKTKHGINDFIDLSPEEYLADPQTHLFRFWDHLPKSS